MLDAAVIRQTYLATGLTDEQLKKIASLADVRNHPSGYVLARQGEPADEMYVVLNGEVRVTTQDGDLLGVVQAGNIVGEIALVDARPRAANVICNGACTLAAFNIKALRQAMLADKDMGLIVLANIAGVLAARLRHADQMIDHLTDKSIDPWALALD